MRILAAPLRALLGCFDFVLSLLLMRQPSTVGLKGKRKVSLQNVTLAFVSGRKRNVALHDVPPAFSVVLVGVSMLAMSGMSCATETITATLTPSPPLVKYDSQFGGLFDTPEDACRHAVAVWSSNTWSYDHIEPRFTYNLKCFALPPLSQTPNWLSDVLIKRSCNGLTWSYGGELSCTQYTCPSYQNWTLSGATCTRPENPKNLAQSCPSTPNPVNIGTGNKYLVETAYTGAGNHPLSFDRIYNSYDSNHPSFWRANQFGRYVSRVSASLTAAIFRGNGKIFVFNKVGSAWVPDSDISDTLTEFTNTAGATTGWRYITSSDEVEVYNASGVFISFADRRGFTQTFSYSDGTAGPNGGYVLDANGNPTATLLPAGRVLRVVDSNGRSLSFGFDANNLTKVTDPAGGVYLYKFGLDGNLISLTFPDGFTKQYLYNESAYTGGTNQPRALTGIIDENGTRYASYYYDTTGRAIKEEMAPGLALGIDQYQMVYNTDSTGNPTSTIVTDPLGTARTYNFTTILGVVKSTGSTQPGGSGCAASSINQTYDANGNVATRTDFNGNSTIYNQYDLTRNLELSRTEAAGTAVARTITTTWHPTYRLPTSITEPGRITTNVYDPTSGNMLSRSIRDTASNKTRTVTYTYTTTADGTLANLLKTVDGPRTDVTDLTSYTYSPNGDLQSVRNALGHTTRITQYDPHGRPQTIIDPNGIVTALTYWPRGWLKSRAVAGETSTYDYDGVGQIKKVTAPDGSFVAYSYDDAHRLTDIYDAQGNRIHYTLDNIGNRTREEVFNNLGTLVTTKSRVFDALNRLWKDIGALNQTTTFEYDANGNLKKIDGPLTTQNDVTVNNYDALNRLASSTDGLNGITRYGYDALDQLRSVTDPRNLITSYAVNALGEQSQLVSPDTGTANSSYDAAGNMSSRTDADGKVVSYSYDALNRVTAIQHNSTPKYTYTYDQGPYAIGKLSSISGGGTTTWSYNAQGRMQNKVQQSGAVSLTTSYAYNPSGQLSSMTYPSGKIVAYSYNSLGQIASISVNGQPVINNASYQAFGPVARWNWGNNSPYVRSFDTDGRLSSYPLGNTNSRSLGFDAASRIQNQTETTPVANTFFNYDELDRLKSWIPPNGNQSYDYDANGNRTRLVIGANSYSNTLSTTSNRLQSVAGPSAKTYSYNLSGNRINDGTNSFSYDSAQRLTSVAFLGGSSAYNINALGQRTLKSGTGVTTTHFTYDEMGKLMGEYNATGQPIEETLYLGDLPVAVLR